MLKKFLLVIGVFITIILTITIVKVIIDSPWENWGETSRVVIGGETFFVEIADTPAAHIKGLSGREKLGDNEGVLFIFPEKSIQKFWMKEMKFSLDIIWINGDKIAGIVYGVEPEASEQLTIYASPEPVDKVLEINAGTASAGGMRVGDIIQLK